MKESLLNSEHEVKRCDSIDWVLVISRKTVHIPRRTRGQFEAGFPRLLDSDGGVQWRFGQRHRGVEVCGWPRHHGIEVGGWPRYLGVVQVGRPQRLPDGLRLGQNTDALPSLILLFQPLLLGHNGQIVSQLLLRLGCSQLASHLNTQIRKNICK